MRRTICLILTGCVLALVLWDPYTLNYNSSDLVMPGPWWQLSLGLLDLGLLAYVLVLLWKRNPPRAFAILAAETVLSLLLMSILYHRDGVGRFRRGFGAEDYLWEYLLAMGLRVVVLALTSPQRKSGHLAPSP